MGLQPQTIVSYEQPDDQAAGFLKIRELAEACGAHFVNDKRPALPSDELTFFIGWQFLVASPSRYAVVFHDSLLPQYRGFAPTVSALINGDPEIGVTALVPNSGVDEGDIIAQKAVTISHPIRIDRALSLQAGLMAELAISIHEAWLIGDFSAQPQDHRCATYSIWRDRDDHIIDWSLSAEEILRFIYAVGLPYAGAITRLGGEELVIDDATVFPDLYFVQRHCGKVWQLDAGRPVVVCGSGLLRLDRVRKNGEVYQFSRLRLRLD